MGRKTESGSMKGQDGGWTGENWKERERRLHRLEQLASLAERGLYRPDLTALACALLRREPALFPLPGTIPEGGCTPEETGKAPERGLERQGNLRA